MAFVENARHWGWALGVYSLIPHLVHVPSFMLTVEGVSSQLPSPLPCLPAMLDTHPSGTTRQINFLP